MIQKFRIYLETHDVLVVEDNFYVLGPSVRIQVGSDNLRLGIELAKQVVSAIQNFIEETEAAVAKRQKQ